MKKYLIVLIYLFLVVGCSEKKADFFYNESKCRLEKAINIQENDVRLEELDTIFTAKINGTDSLFMIGYKFVIVAKNQRKLKFEYIYKNLHNQKKELLISTLTERSIEDSAKEILDKVGGSYHNALFVFAATCLEIKGKDIE